MRRRDPEREARAARVSRALHKIVGASALGRAIGVCRSRAQKMCEVGHPTVNAAVHDLLALPHDKLRALQSELGLLGLPARGELDPAALCRLSAAAVAEAMEALQDGQVDAHEVPALRERLLESRAAHDRALAALEAVESVQLKLKAVG